MSYNPYYSSTPPRPFRIIFGTVMAMAGLIMGMSGAVHNFHTASVMQGEPVEMDWETLVSEGYGDNPHIRLVDIEVLDPYDDMDIMFDDDDIDEMMADPMLRSHLQSTNFGAAKVIPLGSFDMDVEDVVFVAAGVRYIDEAYRQIDETGGITGMVSTYSVSQMNSDFVAFCAGEEIQGPPKKGEDVTYTITPVEGTPNLSDARYLFLLAGFSCALGLIMCGSGGPGIWCCWYAPLPSVLSLIGYPMRYGRGGWSTRIGYIAFGSVLMGYGYYQLVPLGNFGSADGNPVFHSFGFASMFIGLAAVLAVPAQITSRALDASVDVQPKKKPVRMSWNQACSLEPVVREIEYEDQILAKADLLPLSGELKEKAQALTAAGFNKAESMQWQREIGLAAATVQLGCQNMVVSDLEYNNESDIIECGLISVLGTGLPIITLSANSGFKQNRPSAKCLLNRSSSSDPAEMLGEHLELVVSEAEQRDTIVVEFHEEETMDIVHLARRVLAELDGTMDGQMVNVGPKKYGRFHFPPAPVPDYVPAV